MENPPVIDKSSPLYAYARQEDEGKSVSVDLPRWIDSDRVEWTLGGYIGTKRFTMIDEMTQNQLRVSTDGVAGPYLMLPLGQLRRIRELLDRHAIRYWVDSQAISLDGKPAIVVINFGRAGDASQIQTLLDETG